MIKICNLDDVKINKSCGFFVTINGEKKSLIVVRLQTSIYVYINSCPHIGAPLDLKPGQFLSHDKKNIVCSTHGALFEIETGQCIFGPCKDKYLEAIPIQINNGEVLLTST